MSETTETVDSTTTEAPQDSVSPEQKGILHDLQAERAKRQDLQKQLEDIQKANEEAEKARLAENEDYKGLLEIANAKVEEYEPVVTQYRTDLENRKTALLEKLGDDADDFKGLDVPALEKVVAKITNLSNNPPGEPGKPGMTPKGEFGGFESLDELARAVARGVPGAREAYNGIRGGA